MHVAIQTKNHTKCGAIQNPSKLDL